MNIICLTKDNRLVDRLESLCAPDLVKAFTDHLAVSETELKSCQVLLVDLKDCLLPDGNTFFSPILALAEVPSYAEAVAVLKCGAKGYGNRYMRTSNLWQAIKSVQAGQIWLPPDVVTELISNVKLGDEKSDREKILEQLSQREQEIALMVAEGMSNKDIAQKKFISLRTVKAHLTSIYEKTNLRSRLELGVRLKR